jgi:hypothetical protein
MMDRLEFNRKLKKVLGDKKWVKYQKKLNYIL